MFKHMMLSSCRTPQNSEVLWRLLIFFLFLVPIIVFQAPLSTNQSSGPVQHFYAVVSGEVPTAAVLQIQSGWAAALWKWISQGEERPQSGISSPLLMCHWALCACACLSQVRVPSCFVFVLLLTASIILVREENFVPEGERTRHAHQGIKKKTEFGCWPGVVLGRGGHRLLVKSVP